MKVPEVDPDDPRLALIGRCVDCRKDSLERRGVLFTCSSCTRVYQLDENGILRAFPQQQTYPLPYVYNTDGYKQWLDAWKEIIDDWIIYKNRFYRWFSMSGFRKIKGFIKKKLTNDETIVDLGCGHGQLFSLVNPVQGIGLDANLRFLQVLKNRFPRVLAIHGDILNTPFVTGSLGCAVSLHTLEHLYFLAEALEEVVRSLKSEGYLFFSIPTEGGWGWELGRRMVTGPFMTRNYKMDIKKIMEVEHINDARRVLKFLKFYFLIEKTVYAPFPFLRTLHLNSSISGLASPRKREWNPYHKKHKNQKD
jgi:SAM-dependent methyltransferase